MYSFVCWPIYGSIATDAQQVPHILLLCCTAVGWCDVTIGVLEEVVGSRIVAVADVGRRAEVACVAIVICDLQRSCDCPVTIM